MEYMQMTLEDWLQTKAKLQAELLGIRKSFVRIGYFLRKIEESKGYENDGYHSIAEFAKREYGLEGSTVSRFMAINREYSIDGYSEQLRPEYEDFSRTQLEEMLQIPEADRTMITPDTPRAEIRELKQFNRQEPDPGQVDGFQELVESFFHENPDVLREVYQAEGEIDRMKEAVIPSGNRSYRKGIYFLMMQDEGLKVKEFRKNPEPVTWQQFFAVMWEIFGEELPEEVIAPAQKEENQKETNEETREETQEETNENEQEREASLTERTETNAESTDPGTEESETGSDERIGGDGERNAGGGVIAPAQKEDSAEATNEETQRKETETYARNAVSNLQISIEKKAWEKALTDAKRLVAYLEELIHESRG